MSARIEVRHEPENSRFVAGSAAAESELTHARAGDMLDYRHTFVPPELRGRGIASALAHFALRYARDHGISVIASCSFVASFVRRNPEYRDVVVR